MITHATDRRWRRTYLLFNVLAIGAVDREGPMRVIALIEDPGIIRRILEHLGLWTPLATERSPPLGAASWPRYADLPLTYHPVPDIA